MVIIVPFSGIILGIIILAFSPFIILEAIEQLFLALLPIFGVIIIIVSNAFLIAGLKEAKSSLFKVFCLAIILFEIVFLSHKIYKEIYIPYFIEVTIEVKNESTSENIYEVQVKYKNEKKWQTVYIESDTDKLEQISVRGAPFSVRTITYSKRNSTKDKSKTKILTYYPQKYIQIPKNEKCSLTYTGNTLKVDNEKFVFDNSPLFDYNVLVYLQPSNPTTIYTYDNSHVSSGKYRLSAFELSSTDILYSRDFPQNVYCYKDESESGILRKETLAKSIDKDGRVTYVSILEPFNPLKPTDSIKEWEKYCVNYRLSEPIKIFDTGSKAYISKEKPNFYRFEVR